MGYIIEVSFNILKHNMVTYMIDVIKNIALEHNCSDIYDFCEMENETRYSHRINHTIISVEFINNLNNLLRFIQKVKKMREYHIECIYTDDMPYHIIYASSHYLKTMEKQSAKEYMNAQKETEINQKETDINKKETEINQKETQIHTITNSKRRERSYSEDDIKIRRLVGIKPPPMGHFIS